MNLQDKAMERGFRESVAVYSGAWWEGKDFHLFFAPGKSDTEIPCEVPVLMFFKRLLKTFWQCKKETPPPHVYELEIIIYGDAERSAWLGAHQGQLRGGGHRRVWVLSK